MEVAEQKTTKQQRSCFCIESFPILFLECGKLLWVANLQIFVESSVKLYQYLLEEGEISVL